MTRANKFICIEDCSECCGCVPLPKHLCTSFKSKAKIKPERIIFLNKNEIGIITPDAKCIFLDRETNKCSIYEDRPKICRDFGIKGRINHRKKVSLCCPYLKSDGTPRPQKEKEKLDKRIKVKLDLLEKLEKEDN